MQIIDRAIEAGTKDVLWTVGHSYRTVVLVLHLLIHLALRICKPVVQDLCSAVVVR